MTLKQAQQIIEHHLEWIKIDKTGDYKYTERAFNEALELVYNPWISVEDEHFVDIEVAYNNESITYEWKELPNCPQEPFLVGLNTNLGFEWAKVVLTENGVEEATDYETVPWGWSILDIQYWKQIHKL